MTKLPSRPQSGPNSDSIKQNDTSVAFTSLDTSVKLVVVYEVLKGIGAVIALLALWFWHSNLQTWLTQFEIQNPTTFTVLFDTQINSVIRMAQKATHNWQVFLILIAGYGLCRFIEAYGLWRDKAWAYWFIVIGYGLLVPVEIYYLIVRPFDWVKLGVLIINILVVIVVYRQIKKKGLV